ncbi:DUF3078 domain-containing protein [candidate division KSB1 bacterium]|nr:DUF3078 domain-containing protein [candidate division KSB1 bacterium]
MKTLSTIGILLLTGTLLIAQEEEAPKYGWQNEATASLNLAQSTFDNYSQGGENSTAWQFRLGLKFVNDQEKFNWANTGKFEYGHSKSGEDESKKSVDEIKVESVMSLKLWQTVNPYASVTGETQFAPGYDYALEPKVQISNLLDPGTFRESIGLAYKPSEIFQARLGAAMKQTVARDFTFRTDDPETDKVEKLHNELGADGVLDFNYKISENSLIKSKVELFSNMKTFDQIDIIWDTDLTAKITKYIGFNFNVKLVYDRDISTMRQLKQIMGIGLSYAFL